VLVQGILVVLVQVYRGPLVLAHPDNSPPASVVLTPLHIVPEWYYLGYYGVLKAVPGRAPGFLVMVSYTLGAGTYGEPYSTGPLEGGHLPAPRYQGVFLLSLVVLYSLWAGAQLPQGRYVSYGRGYILVSLGCNIGYIPCPRPPTSSLTPYHSPVQAHQLHTLYLHGIHPREPHPGRGGCSPGAIQGNPWVIPVSIYREYYWSVTTRPWTRTTPYWVRSPGCQGVYTQWYYG